MNNYSVRPPKTKSWLRHGFLLKQILSTCESEESDSDFSAAAISIYLFITTKDTPKEK